MSDSIWNGEACKMTDPVRTLQTVPVAVAVSILLAGIMWYATATHSAGLASNNAYLRPSTADCGPTWLAETNGYMAHWMHAQSN